MEQLQRSQLCQSGNRESDRDGRRNYRPYCPHANYKRGYFLRAYYHLKLLLNWKEIIIRDKYITSQAELSKGLSPRPDAWDFIIEDLKRATALPSSYDNDNIGRATSGAANAYLGFAYLTRAYEESDKKTEYLNEALTALNNVKGYELVKKFSSMFDASNKNSKESIFELTDFHE